MSVPHLTGADSAALIYLERGYAVVNIPAGKKGPRGKKWQQDTITAAAVPERFPPRSNVGIKTGKVSGWLVDIDLDAPEAVALGRLWLPATKMQHGRPGKPLSHWWYVSQGAETRKYLDPVIPDRGKATLLEIRASSSGGDGMQTLAPPSVNAESANPPERLEWVSFGEPFEIPAVELERVAAMVAAGALILRYWKDGSRHDSTLPLAGALLHNGWPEELVQQFMGGVASVAGADLAKVRRDVRGTAERHQRRERVTGIPTLKDFMPAAVVERVCQWLGLHAGASSVSIVAGGDTFADARLENLTDLSNARLFVGQHHAEIRYVHDARRWYIFDGRRWTPDACGQVERLAKSTVESLFQIAASEPEPDRRDKIRRHALKSQDGHRIESTLKLARSEPEVSITSAVFDGDPWLLNCENGTIDLRSGVLRAHNRAEMLTKLAPVAFDPAAESPLWRAFLEKIMAANPELIAFLQRALGYSLTGDTSEQKFFVAWGGGANGKSTFLRIGQSLLGDYALSTSIETLVVKRGGGASNDIARLAGARFVSAVEAEEGQRLAEERVKHMTGGDSIAARFLYQEHFEFRPTFKLWLATNHRPQVRGTDEAIWRRINLIPFTVSIPESEQDLKLTEKLQTELTGILAWAVAGCLRWQATGLREPREVREATADYRQEEDVIGGFLEECCYVEPTASTTARDLYAAYTAWCLRSGEKVPLSQKKLGPRLRERGFESGRDPSGDRKTWRGVGLQPVGAFA